VTFSCAVLAGGESRRMGRDKAFVDFDGRSLLVRIVERLETVSDDVFVVARDGGGLASLGPRVYRDTCDARTPLAGILTALHMASQPSVFICATDMPHVSPRLIELIASRSSVADVVVAEHDGRLEPLHAVWSVTAAGVIEAEIAAGERAVHRVLERLRVAVVHEDVWRPVDPSGASFTNVNTPDELLAAQDQSGRRSA
jgi:molybdenum cofactor guanylyltransferase